VAVVGAADLTAAAVTTIAVKALAVERLKRADPGVCAANEDRLGGSRLADRQDGCHCGGNEHRAAAQASQELSSRHTRSDLLGNLIESFQHEFPPISMNKGQLIVVWKWRYLSEQ
jgi:hypothetical protein